MRSVCCARTLTAPDGFRMQRPERCRAAAGYPKLFNCVSSGRWTTYIAVSSPAAEIYIRTCAESVLLSQSAPPPANVVRANCSVCPGPTPPAGVSLVLLTPRRALQVKRERNESVAYEEIHIG
ncbi:hypothetical protein MTO96_049667 [Rhipicephalus appendiculatus]